MLSESILVVWRRGWDVLSRFAPSASPSGRRTQSRYRGKVLIPLSISITVLPDASVLSGGEGGIRTHVSFRENRFSRAAPSATRQPLQLSQTNYDELFDHQPFMTQNWHELQWFVPEGGQLRFKLRWLKDSTIIRPAIRSFSAGGRLQPLSNLSGISPLAKYI
jgi:hypothetical protein